MTSVVIEIKGADKIRSDLERFPEKAAKVYGKAVQDAAAVFRDHTKKLPPVSAKSTGYGVMGIPVDTGRLRGSIRKKKLQKLAAGVGPDVKYGRYVHEGTRRMPGRPFLEWSLKLGGQRLIDAIFVRASSLLP